MWSHRIVFLTMLIGFACAPAALPAAATTRPADLLPMGSAWRGELHVDERKPNVKSPACAFKVTQRDEKAFIGEYTLWTNDGKVTVKVEGIVGDKGVIRAKATEVLAGDLQEIQLKQEWSGAVTDDVLQFTFKMRTGAVRTSKMKRTKADGNRRKKNEQIVIPSL